MNFISQNIKLNKLNDITNGNLTKQTFVNNITIE